MIEMPNQQAVIGAAAMRENAGRADKMR